MFVATRATSQIDQPRGVQLEYRVRAINKGGESHGEAGAIQREKSEEKEITSVLKAILPCVSFVKPNH
jgi:hypothetical protein